MREINEENARKKINDQQINFYMDVVYMCCVYVCCMYVYALNFRYILQRVRESETKITKKYIYKTAFS